MRVSIACRPRGSSRRSSRRDPHISPARACAGSAWRSCAARAARSAVATPTVRAPFPSSAARWRTPKRCCSSTTATASARKLTSGSINACVPTSSDSSPLCELAQDVVAPARRGRAGQQRAGYRLAADQPLHSGEMLLGERLRRRHQRGLPPVLDRAQHRVQRHHRLSAAHLPHQQPLHRPRALASSWRILSTALRWSPVSSNGRPSLSQRSLSSGGSPHR